jgi:hypothetical protein
VTASYLDASALLRWSEAKIPNAESRNTRAAAHLTRLIDGADRVALSEITLAEFQSNVATHVRSPVFADCDQTWATTVVTEVMGWIATGRLEVLPSIPRMIAWAFTQVEVATRENGIALAVWDAAHIGYATTWARSLNEVVELLTTDSNFTTFLGAYPAFAVHIRVVDPST